MGKSAAQRARAAARLENLSLLLFTLALVLTVVLRETSESSHPKLIPAALLSGAVFLLCAYLVVARGTLPRLRTADIWIMAFAILAVSSITWAQATRPAVVRSVEIAGIALAFLLARTLARTWGRQRVILSALAATALVTALYGCYQYAFEFDDLIRLVLTRPEALREVRGITPLLVPDLVSRIEGREVFSLFVVSNVFAAYLMPFIALVGALVVWAWRSRDRARLGICGAALVILCGTFALTKSKGALLAAGAVLAAGALWWMLGRRRKTRILLAALTVLCVVVVIALARRADWNEVGRRGGSLGVRLGFWKGALAVAVERPLLGVGAGNFTDAYFAHKPDWAHEVQNAHSSLFQTLAEFGALGALLAAAFVAAWIYEWRRTLRSAIQAPASENDDRVVVGLSGPVALGLVALVFRGEHPLTIAAFVAIWCAGYLAFHYVLAGKDPGTVREATSLGLFAGLAALALHSLIDFDLDVTAIGLNAAALAGLLAADPAVAGPARRPSRAGRWALLIGSAGAFAFLAFGVVIPIGKAETLLDRAQRALDSRDSAEAIALAKESAGADPFFTEAYALAGDAYTLRYHASPEKNAEDYDEAVTWYWKAIATAPRKSALWRTLGMLHESASSRHKSRLYRAKLTYETALALYPSDTTTLLALGRLCERIASEHPGVNAPLVARALWCYGRVIEIAEQTTERRMRLTPEELDMIRAKRRELETLLDRRKDNGKRQDPG
ncbi:MAG: O-antigen ligase family protein [Planctomycetota bacterium]